MPVQTGHEDEHLQNDDRMELPDPQTDPEVIVAICEPKDAAKIKTAIDKYGKQVDLFLADASESEELIRILGDASEGIEGTSPTTDPSTNFSSAYLEKFGHNPPDYAAAGMVVLFNKVEKSPHIRPSF